MGRVATRHRIIAFTAVLCAIGAPVALGACSSSGGGSNQACPASVDVTVHAKDTFRFSPDRLTASPGKLVVKLVNDGSLNHTFEIHGISGKISVSGHGTGCATFNVPKGEWNYYCGVAGHEAAGMKGTLSAS